MNRGPDDAIRLSVTTSVTDVVIEDFAVVLRFGDDIYVRIEDPIHIVSASGEERTLQSEEFPADGRAALTAGLGLHLPVGRTADVLVLESGEIRILPADGSVIRSGPGTGFEAWQLHVARALIVSLPSGGLMEFGPPAN